MDDRIKRTIEKLKAIDLVGDSHENLSAICSALYGEKPEFGWTRDACETLRDVLIELLRQADPDTHMELPRDADGVPIHIGDELEGADVITNGQRCTVRGFERNAKGEYECISDNHIRHKCEWWRRYRKPTVEDVLRDFGDDVRRCCDTEDTIAEYANRLREVMRDE